MSNFHTELLSDFSEKTQRKVATLQNEFSTVQCTDLVPNKCEIRKLHTSRAADSQTLMALKVKKKGGGEFLGSTVTVWYSKLIQQPLVL